MKWQDAAAASRDGAAYRVDDGARIDFMVRWTDDENGRPRCLVGGPPPEPTARAARPGECDGFDDWEPRRR